MDIGAFFFFLWLGRVISWIQENVVNLHTYLHISTWNTGNNCSWELEQAQQWLG